ncbi:DNA polymerase [Luteipulveratus sp. YIM 133132]|uniref:DNA polymerase n=1 Tax=Luteipulveratus flavus TaxID=3031728 RepID=UPI0023AF6C61|nr:DNA polymerase [Luteipulveratus sp. YIM 133132]MDE9366123.1 DNA polymerase [Luteipulveratus sp. YIM 133132]
MQPVRRALVVDSSGRHAVVVESDASDPVASGPIGEVVERVAAYEAQGPSRWVWWNRSAAAPAVEARVVLRRCWDLQEVHRLLVGGWSADPDEVWAVSHGLAPGDRPSGPTGDLFDSTDADEPLVRDDGYLGARALDPAWPAGPEECAAWGVLALRVARRQEELLRARSGRALSTAYSESGAGLLCLELARDGLPIDRARMSELITLAAGPRPETDAHAAAIRRERDQLVLQHVPGRERTDLRNPAQVLQLLNAVGVRVDDTRSWRLDPYRGMHPVVEALLAWRKSERIATTYGWTWLDRFVGEDDRLRGEWTVCDGGAGRMTAGAGLHSLPAPLRPGVAAGAGQVLIRADLGQVEPRVLAVVSGDRAFAAATAADDLYADVAARLRIDRPVAKIAVLAAMYGQTSGAAGEALTGLERAYPTAMAYLGRAAETGERGEAVTTYGGRRVPVDEGGDPARRRAVGRFTRNAVVQGAAAELFKAWALTVRAGIVPIGGQIVLCLHDELVLHVPHEHADEGVRVVHGALKSAAHHWSGGAPVRFVADVSVVHRWSEAK